MRDPSPRASHFSSDWPSAGIRVIFRHEIRLLLCDLQGVSLRPVADPGRAGAERGAEDIVVLMNRIGRPRNSRAGRAEKEAEKRIGQLALLEELKSAAERLGLSVREERLLREVGYRVRSGSCRLRDSEVLFVDRGLPVSAQIDVLVDELAARSLDAVYLSPAARALLERAAARRTRREGNGSASAQ